MIQVFNTLLPVFAIIGLGYLLARREALSRRFMSELNWLIFRVSLPALIVHSLATTPRLPADTLSLVVIFFAVTLLVSALAFPVARLLGLPPERVGTFVQASYRGNLAYTGLPIVIFAMNGQDSEAVASAVAQVMFVLAPGMLLYNTLAVIFLVSSSEGSAPGKVRQILWKVASNPLILASLVGTTLFALPFELPPFLLNTLELTGQMAPPAALFCVGGAIAFVSMEGRYRSASVATVLKVLATPALTLACLSLVDVSDRSRMILLILSACPTAVVSYIMAKELKGDEALAAGSIIISTVACIPVLGLIIALA